jgi:protein SCO1
MTDDTVRAQRRALWIVVGVALALVVAAGVAFAPRPAPRFHGTVYDAAPAAEFSLVDHDGHPVSLRSYRGAPVLLFFGYTQCPDICPTTLTKLTRAMRTARAEEVRVLLVTVDPAHDTPATLKAYAGHFGPAVTGLTGDSAALARARAGYGAYVTAMPDAPAAAHSGHGARAATAPAAKLAHSGVVYGIDRRGNLRVVIADDATPEQVADDVRTLSRM